MEGTTTTILKGRSKSLVMTFRPAEIISHINCIRRTQLIYFSIAQRYFVQQIEKFYWIIE